MVKIRSKIGCIWIIILTLSPWLIQMQKKIKEDHKIMCRLRGKTSFLYKFINSRILAMSNFCASVYRWEHGYVMK